MTQSALIDARLKFRFGWVTDSRHDLLFFFMPVIVGLVVVLSAITPVAWAATCMFLANEVFPFVGSFHGGVSWFHYWDKDNRQYFASTAKRFIVFFVIPFGIVAATIAASVAGWNSIVYAVYMFWTVQHLAQQNVGILLLYQNRIEGEVQLPRSVHARTQQIPAVLFGSCFLLHAPTFDAFAVAFAAILSVNYLREVYIQARRGAIVNVPSVAFAMLAVWFFLPLLLIKTAYWPAMILPLFVHWCQYIGLNYVLVKRKYAPKPGAPRAVLRPVLAFLGWSAVFAALLTVFSHVATTSKTSMRGEILGGIVMGFALAHYFQDAFLWRFRESFNREAILKYLKAQTQLSS